MFRHETFYYLWVKSFFDIRREIHNLSMLTFPSAPTTTCGTRRKASVSPESQPSSSKAGTQLTDFSQISAHASGAWRHSHLVISYLGFYFDICEWRVLSAHAWTPAFMLHLTNPCAKRKVPSPTKPKGKIYKTKSLGHYITNREARKLKYIKFGDKKIVESERAKQIYCSLYRYSVFSDFNKWLELQWQRNFT